MIFGYSDPQGMFRAQVPMCKVPIQKHSSESLTLYLGLFGYLGPSEWLVRSVFRVQAVA